MFGNSRSKPSCIHCGSGSFSCIISDVLARKICLTAKQTQIKSCQTSSHKTATATQIKYFLVAPDQMQTLHSPGEILTLLRRRGMCRCLWHRERFFRVPTTHPHPKTHTVHPFPGCKAMQSV